MQPPLDPDTPQMSGSPSNAFRQETEEFLGSIVRYVGLASDGIEMCLIKDPAETEVMLFMNKAIEELNKNVGESKPLPFILDEELMWMGLRVRDDFKNLIYSYTTIVACAAFCKLGFGDDVDRILALPMDHLTEIQTKSKIETRSENPSENQSASQLEIQSKLQSKLQSKIQSRTDDKYGISKCLALCQHLKDEQKSLKNPTFVLGSWMFSMFKAHRELCVALGQIKNNLAQDLRQSISAFPARMKGVCRDKLVVPQESWKEMLRQHEMRCLKLIESSRDGAVDLRTESKTLKMELTLILGGLGLRCSEAERREAESHLKFLQQFTVRASGDQLSHPLTPLSAIESAANGPASSPLRSVLSIGLFVADQAISILGEHDELRASICELRGFMSTRHQHDYRGMISPVTLFSTLTLSGIQREILKINEDARNVVSNIITAIQILQVYTESPGSLLDAHKKIDVDMLFAFFSGFLSAVEKNKAQIGPDKLAGYERDRQCTVNILDNLRVIQKYQTRVISSLEQLSKAQALEKCTDIDTRIIFPEAGTQLGLTTKDTLDARTGNEQTHGLSAGDDRRMK